MYCEPAKTRLSVSSEDTFSQFSQFSQLSQLSQFSLHLLSGVNCMCCAGQLSVVSGGQFCSVDEASGNCASDGPGVHGNNEACEIRVGSAGTLDATEFNTETGYDYITLLDERYEGTTAPHNIPVQDGQNFSWLSDGSITNTGWTICLTPDAEVWSDRFTVLVRCTAGCAVLSTEGRSQSCIGDVAILNERAQTTFGCDGDRVTGCDPESITSLREFLAASASPTASPTWAPSLAPSGSPTEATRLSECGSRQRLFVNPTPTTTPTSTSTPTPTLTPCNPNPNSNPNPCGGVRPPAAPVCGSVWTACFQGERRDGAALSHFRARRRVLFSLTAREFGRIRRNSLLTELKLLYTFTHVFGAAG